MYFVNFLANMEWNRGPPALRASAVIWSGSGVFPAFAVSITHRTSLLSTAGAISLASRFLVESGMSTVEAYRFVKKVWEVVFMPLVVVVLFAS